VSPIGYLSLFILVLSILWAGERVRSALLRWEQTQYGWALQQLALLRRLEGREVQIEEGELPAVIARVIVEATGEAVDGLRFFDVQAEPPWAMTFCDSKGSCYTFTPCLDRAGGLRRGRWFVVDALTTHVDVAEELAAAFDIALGMRGMEEAILPASQQWGLLVWSGPKGDCSR